MTLESTSHLPKEPAKPENLRNKWVRPDIAAEALGMEEGTIKAWMGQKKVRSTSVGPNRLVDFNALERFVQRLPKPHDAYDQKEMIRKQASQVTAAITRLTNLLTDTGQADLFHQIPSFQSPVNSMDATLWTLAKMIEEFRAALGGTFYEQGYRTTTTQPLEVDNDDG